MESEGSLPHSQVPATVSILSQLNPVHTPSTLVLMFLGSKGEDKILKKMVADIP
jgi:hypothetical protein